MGDCSFDSAAEEKNEKLRAQNHGRVGSMYLVARLVRFAPKWLD